MNVYHGVSRKTLVTASQRSRSHLGVSWKSLCNFYTHRVLLNITMHKCSSWWDNVLHTTLGFAALMSMSHQKVCWKPVIVQLYLANSVEYYKIICCECLPRPCGVSHTALGWVYYSLSYTISSVHWLTTKPFFHHQTCNQRFSSFYLFHCIFISSLNF